VAHPFVGYRVNQGSLQDLAVAATGGENCSTVIGSQAFLVAAIFEDLGFACSRMALEAAVAFVA